MHELLFGRWQDKSIDPIADLRVPGLYFNAARTFGFKGLLGGTHSWLTHVTNNLAHTVIEVTDIETLHVQGTSFYSSLCGQPIHRLGFCEKRVFMSDRHGCQRWFGHEPQITYLGPVELDNVLTWARLYPKLQHKFHTLTTNCNTFTSWILHILGIELWSGIGAKTWSI